jgi:hypothetical protein
MHSAASSRGGPERRGVDQNECKGGVVPEGRGAGRLGRTGHSPRMGHHAGGGRNEVAGHLRPRPATVVEADEGQHWTRGSSAGGDEQDDVTVGVYRWCAASWRRGPWLIRPSAWARCGRWQRKPAAASAAAASASSPRAAATPARPMVPIARRCARACLPAASPIPPARLRSAALTVAPWASHRGGAS